MTQRRTWVEKAPVGLATTGSGGGAARRLKARLAKENWEVAPGFKFRPGFIYTQVRAISARINQNYDGWPADELEKSYRTFIGKPCFVNHQNENPKEARGVVVASRYVENGRDKYVDVIQEIDAQRYPKLAHEIITGGMDSVSMGAEAAFTICSYCKHKATDEHDMCNHVKFHKGEKLAKFNRRTGKTENVLVYESCHKLSFFELSYVFEPADETAVASRVVVAGIRKEAPFAGYKDFAACVAANQDKDNPEAYCGEIKHRTEDKTAAPRKRKTYDPNTVYGNPDAEPCVHKLDAASQNLYDMAVSQGMSHEEAAAHADRNERAEASTYEDPCPGGCDDVRQASFEARVLQAVATGSDCLPGQPCNKAPGLDLAKMPKGTPGGSSGAPASPAAPGGAPAAGGTPVGGTGGVPLIKNPDGTYTSSDPAWAALIARESGGNPTIVNTDPNDANAGANASQGLFQFTPQTWQGLGYSGNPKDATAEQQAEAAAKLLRQNPSGSDWGAGLPGREDAGALARGLQPMPAEITSKFERRVLHMAGYKTTTFEDRVLRAAGMVRLAEPKDKDKEPKDKDRDTKSQTKGPANPQQPLNPGMPPVPAGTQGTYTGPDAPAPGAPPAAPDAQHGQAQGAPPGPGGAALEDWQLPGGTNPTDKSGPGGKGLAMPFAQSQVGQYSPTLKHTVTTEDVTNQANQDRIKAWDTANPTNVFDREMKYDPASMEKGVQHIFTKPGPEGAGAPPPPAAGAPGAPPVPAAPAAPPPEPVTPPAPSVPALPEPPKLPGPDAITPPPANPITPQASRSFERRVLRLAYGETEAPFPVDTLREEGSAPEDANDDFHHYVSPPEGLRDPDLTQAGQLQGPQPEQGVGGMGANPEDNPGVDANYMILKVPMPGTAPPGPMQPPPQPGGAMPPQIPAPPQGQPPGIPMQSFASRVLRVAGWAEDNPAWGHTMNHIDKALAEGEFGPEGDYDNPDLDYCAECGAGVPPEEYDSSEHHRDWCEHHPDNQFMANHFANTRVPRSLLAGVDQYLGIDAGATTLGNGRGVSQTSRKPRKGQTMGRTNTLAQRGKVASQGKRQHYAEGPQTDGGPYGRNDEGEQQDVFLTQPPPPEHVEAPDEDTQDISNTKGNLVARVQQGRAQLLRDAQALAAYQAREGSRHQGEALVGGGGVIDPSVQDSESEALTGDHFEALGEAPVRTDPKQAARQAENSLSAFQAFDKWLHSATGRQARHHTAKNIRLAADEWAKRANYDVKVLFPALGIVLRQARKIEAAQTKGAKMQKRADEKLDLAAPDARIDVEAPVANVTDAEAQESQFDTGDFANNAGDSLADPDLSTDSQFWAPGEGSKKARKEPQRRPTPAGGILAVRAAEAYINAGLERPESKYQLAGMFENMNKGVVSRDIALLERVAQLQSQQRQKVASGRTRGAASPLPAGLSSGGIGRVASVQRMAANDPSNDALLFD